MKLRLPLPKRKLKATATRRMPQRAIEEDEEPTMKLSSAFVVVLLLHLVAVGGIYAFNSVKAHHPTAFEETDAKPIVRTSEAAAPVSVTQAPTLPIKNEVAAVEKAPEPIHKTPVAPNGLKDSGVIHTVAKGENPVLIAKKLGVNYDDLLKLNRIEDPKKLQIGQKLHIPMKTRTAAN